MFAFGGTTACPGTPEPIVRYSETHEYLFATNTWVPRAAMPRPRTDRAVAVTGGKVYLFGGDCCLEPPTDVYDPATDTWSAEPNMPGPINWGSAAAVGNSVLRAGGVAGVGGACLSSCAYYDTTTKTWTPAPDLCEARSYGSMVVANGQCLYAGGLDATCAARNTVFALTLDTTVPSAPAVTDDGPTTTVGTELHATWSSSDSEFAITEYRYAIGTSATDPGSGYVVDWKSAGTATEVTETGLSLLPWQTYYWYVKAKNGAGLWSEVGVSDGIRMAAEIVMTPGAAKLLPDGTGVGLFGARVTAMSAEMSGRIYVEDPMRSSGIAVLSSAEVTEGDVVNVAGLMATNSDGERTITEPTVAVTGHDLPLAALATNLRSAASGPWQYQASAGTTVKGQRGVTDPPGDEMNTIGLLLQVHGVVMDMDGSFVFLNDGAWPDRTGVRVLRANLPPELKVGDYVRLTGISSMRKTSMAYQLVIRPRRASDVVVVVPASEGLLQNSLWRALLKL